jgi:3-hydroxyisobutyrate dehydrogenase-like beta-hydroxyacid dehydrogenase
MQTIGILGLGIIGSRVAENVAKAGYPTAVWSHSPRERADFCASPAAVAQKADILQLFVRDDAALLSAIADVLPELTTRHIVLAHSTCSPTAVKQAAAQVTAKGAHFLDAPFTGSKMAAQNGKLVYYIGGSAQLLEQVQPLLLASGAKALHVGEIGAASTLKIATNLITAVTVKGVAEALAITRTAGIDPALLLAAEEPNANFSPLIGMKLPAMISGDYSPHFSLQNMLKDADFALGLAADAGLQLPALSSMAEAMRRQMAAGKANEDFSVIGSEV